jgi:hypothetical protein
MALRHSKSSSGWDNEEQSRWHNSYLETSQRLLSGYALTWSASGSERHAHARKDARDNHMKSTQCDSVKEQVSGAWPIWYMEVIADFKSTRRGLANLSSPLSTQHTMMTLRLKTFQLPIILESYIKYSENNLSTWQTHWKFKSWTKWGTNLKSRSHTCINHKEIFHRKLEIATYRLASVAKPMVQYVRIIQVKVSKMDKGNRKK